MFENILHAPLKLRNGVSEAARSLLEGLLQRDAKSRLGGSGDQVELQDHPFFASINWDDLLAKKIRPPFIPNVVKVMQILFFNSSHYILLCVLIPSPLLQSSPCDVSYIDPEFTHLPVPASVNERCQAGGNSEAFPGFSYMNPVEYVAVEPVS